MSDEAKVLAMLFLENIVIMICFTVLAVVFNHWWIVLFSAFFISTFKNKENKTE